MWRDSFRNAVKLEFLQLKYEARNTNVDRFKKRQNTAVLDLWNLPGQHAPEACPRAPGDQKAHRGVCDAIPSSAYEKDDGRIEGVHLVKTEERTAPLVKQHEEAEKLYIIHSNSF